LGLGGLVSWKAHESLNETEARVAFND
jgi:hypothetical protein